MKKTTIVVAVAILVASGYGLYRRHRENYPFGSSHRCDKILAMALYQYAQAYGGAYPAGQATPEASLSLISTLDEYSYCGYLLRRRDVSEKVVQGMLDRGELLGPETCGWNYVEGLRVDSGSNVALFWDKEGLNEMGGRLPDGGHIVTFVGGGGGEYIPASEWDAFFEEQRVFLAAARARAQNAEPPEDPPASEMGD